MSFVKNIPYVTEGDSNGSDLEFAKIGTRQYSFAGSEINGLQIIDITKPQEAKRVAVFDCAVSQGDVQVFKRGKKTLLTYTNDYEDTTEAAESTCYEQATAAGFEATDTSEDATVTAKLGTLIVDVSKPTAPKTVSFVPIPTGSHNMTVHPSGNFLYNSNSDLITNFEPTIEVFDIRNLAEPTQTASMTFTALPGLGTQSHDITFNADGTRAYSAALSHGVILDTTDPADPSVVSEFDDEAINVWHQASPYTVRDENGDPVRELLLVEDEVAGAAGPAVCPTGGFHVFDVTDESLPLKVGYWNIDDIQAKPDDPLNTCTAHVFQIHEREQIMTVAYYMGGVRVVDLRGLADAPVGVGQGSTALGGAMKQIGFYQTGNAFTWAAKTPGIEKDGSFYLYGDDLYRGFDVYRFDASKPASTSTGTFLSPAQAEIQLDNLTAATTEDRRPGDYKSAFCLIRDGQIRS